MFNQVEPELISPLFEEFQNLRYVTIATVDYETGGPNVNAISWVMAKNKTTIVFVVNKSSRIVENIKNNKYVVINTIIGDSSYSISGQAVVKEEKLPNIPLKLTLIEMEITEVRDVMFYGAKITSPPQFMITYDDEAAEKLNNQVKAALQKA